MWDVGEHCQRCRGQVVVLLLTRWTCPIDADQVTFADGTMAERVELHATPQVKTIYHELMPSLSFTLAAEGYPICQNYHGLEFSMYELKAKEVLHKLMQQYVVIKPSVKLELADILERSRILVMACFAHAHRGTPFYRFLEQCGFAAVALILKYPGLVPDRVNPLDKIPDFLHAKYIASMVPYAAESSFDQAVPFFENYVDEQAEWNVSATEEGKRLSMASVQAEANKRQMEELKQSILAAVRAEFPATVHPMPTTSNVHNIPQVYPRAVGIGGVASHVRGYGASQPGGVSQVAPTAHHAAVFAQGGLPPVGAAAVPGVFGSGVAPLSSSHPSHGGVSPVVHQNQVGGSGRELVVAPFSTYPQQYFNPVMHTPEPVFMTPQGNFAPQATPGVRIEPYVSPAVVGPGGEVGLRAPFAPLYPAVPRSAPPPLSPAFSRQDGGVIDAHFGVVQQALSSQGGVSYVPSARGVNAEVQVPVEGVGGEFVSAVGAGPVAMPVPQVLVDAGGPSGLRPPIVGPAAPRGSREVRELHRGLTAEEQSLAAQVPSGTGVMRATRGRRGTGTVEDGQDIPSALGPFVTVVSEAHSGGVARAAGNGSDTGSAEGPQEVAGEDRPFAAMLHAGSFRPGSRASVSSRGDSVDLDKGTMEDYLAAVRAAMVSGGVVETPMSQLLRPSLFLLEVLFVLARKEFQSGPCPRAAYLFYNQAYGRTLCNTANMPDTHRSLLSRLVNLARLAMFRMDADMLKDALASRCMSGLREGGNQSSAMIYLRMHPGCSVIDFVNHLDQAHRRDRSDRARKQGAARQFVGGPVAEVAQVLGSSMSKNQVAELISALEGFNATRTRPPLSARAGQVVSRSGAPAATFSSPPALRRSVSPLPQVAGATDGAAISKGEVRVTGAAQFTGTPSAGAAKEMNGGQQSGESVVCYNCSQPGHISRDCPKPRSRSPSPPPTVRKVSFVPGGNLNPKATAAAMDAQAIEDLSAFVTPYDDEVEAGPDSGYHQVSYWYGVPGGEEDDPQVCMTCAAEAAWDPQGAEIWYDARECWLQDGLGTYPNAAVLMVSLGQARGNRMEGRLPVSFDPPALIAKSNVVQASEVWHDAVEGSPDADEGGHHEAAGLPAFPAVALAANPHDCVPPDPFQVSLGSLSSVNTGTPRQGIGEVPTVDTLLAAGEDQHFVPDSFDEGRQPVPFLMVGQLPQRSRVLSTDARVTLAYADQRSLGTCVGLRTPSLGRGGLLRVKLVMFDAGANVNLICLSLARRLGLHWESVAISLGTSVGTASGPTCRVTDPITLVLAPGTPYELALRDAVGPWYVVPDTNTYMVLLGLRVNLATAGFHWPSLESFVYFPQVAQGVLAGGVSLPLIQFDASSAAVPSGACRAARAAHLVGCATEGVGAVDMPVDTDNDDEVLVVIHRRAIVPLKASVEAHSPTAVKGRASRRTFRTGQCKTQPG